MQNLKETKVIFVDIDRTLTDNNRQVPIKNIEAIKKARQKGILVVLCSGRSFAYATRISKEAQASHLVISNNGAQIYDYERENSIYIEPIKKEVLLNILEEFSNMNIEFILNTDTTRYGTRDLTRKLDSSEKIIENFKEIEDKNILQIVGEAENYEKMQELISIVGKYNDLKILNLSKAFIEKRKNVKNYYADIDKKEVNKGVGIKKFLEIFNIKKDEAICFGDYVNDLDMFDACGTKIAMDNASKEVKDKADYITLSNEEAGVGDFIEKYII